MLLLCTAILASHALGSEKDDFQVTPSGVKYKLTVANPTGQQVVENGIIVFTSAMFINDSLVSENTTPTPMPVHPQYTGDLHEVVLLMHEGETMTFAFDPMDYYGGQLPPKIKETDVIKMTISIAKAQSMEEYEAEQAIVAEKLIAEEKATLLQYMKDNGINGVEMPNGMFIAITQEGTGEQAQSGNTVSVHYTGKLLTGKVFDSSVARGTPIRFQVGVGQVIRGWDEGIVTMKVGEKAIFLIPSPLAYGERDMGEIPSNSPLIFEVELVEIH